MPLHPRDPPGFPATIPSPASLDELHAVMVRCTRCDLFLERTQVVPGDGPAEARVLFIGEAPGVNEDRLGLPFVGKSGALLGEMLHEAGFTRESVFIANLVRCRPPRNRNPRTVEIRACAGWLREQLRIVAPALVITLGRHALQFFIPTGRITQMQGTLHTVDGELGSLALYPLLHPAAVIRDPRLRTSYAASFRRIPSILAAMTPVDEYERHRG